MKPSRTLPNRSSGDSRTLRVAFTMIELLVVLAIVGLLMALLVPGLARSRSSSSALRCVNNHRQLILAWKMYATDSNEGLPISHDSFPSIPGRPKWIAGILGFSSSPSSWDPNVDVVASPLWPYTAGQADIFRCPSDQSTVLVAGERLPRVRSISMSQVFGSGEWLGGPSYRTYAALSEIRIPAKTFVFTDEHPDSINDGGFANRIADAEPSSPPGNERIIDFPGGYHNGACTLSFSDGRVEVHAWTGSEIQPPPRYDGSFLPAITAGDSGLDIRWLAENTTVRE